MSGAGAGAAAGAAAHAAAIAQATKASGVIVNVGPEDFQRIVDLNKEPLVVHSTGGFFSTVHCYLTSYRGLAFYAKSEYPLSFGRNCEMVEAQRIWIPG